MKLFRENWSSFLMLGLLTASLSILIFGSLIYTFITNPGAWLYIGLLSFCGFSMFISSILMIYDSLRLKIKEELDESQKVKIRDRSKEIEDHIKLLNDECERIKPESMR